jgi:hypothetical protein
MFNARAQIAKLGGERVIARAISTLPAVYALKLIDEYNYSRFTKGWIEAH